MSRRTSSDYLRVSTDLHAFLLYSGKPPGREKIPYLQDAHLSLVVEYPVYQSEPETAVFEADHLPSDFLAAWDAGAADAGIKRAHER
jgi:hypothetical protein